MVGGTRTVSAQLIEDLCLALKHVLALAAAELDGHNVRGVLVVLRYDVRS